MAQIDVDMSGLPIPRDPQQVAREAADAYEDDHLGEDLTLTGFCLGIGLVVVAAAVVGFLLDQGYRAVEALFLMFGG